jgi:hypothetical protein
LKFSELWRISSKVYTELSFQSVFSLRTGGILPQRSQDSIRRLVSNAKLNTAISKLLMTLFIVASAFAGFFSVTEKTSVAGLSEELMMVGNVATFMAVVLFLISFMGLQVSTSFVSSKVVEILSPLPLSSSDVSNIVLLCFLRIFDIPLIAAVVAPLIAYYLFGGSLLGGPVLLVGVIVTEIFAVTLCMGLAKFFYSKVTSGGGKSRWQTLLRFVFMILWIIPSFGVYFVMNFATHLVEVYAVVAQTLSSFLYLLVLLYPFSYGFLASYATFPISTELSALSLSVMSCLAYCVVAAYSFRWVRNTIREVGAVRVGTRLREVVRDTVVSPQSPWLGIIHKDIRLASRSPSYASLLFLPAIETVVLAVSFSFTGAMGLSFILGLLTWISMFELLLPPTLISMEGLAASYTRSLPISKKTIVLSKALLTSITYITSLMVLLVAALYFKGDIASVLIFGITNLFSVVAAATLELTLLTNKLWKESFATGNMYARLSSHIMFVALGFIVVAVPMTGAFTALFLAPHLVLPVFLALALAEFALTMVYVGRAKIYGGRLSMTKANWGSRRLTLTWLAFVVLIFIASMIRSLFLLSGLEMFVIGGSCIIYWRNKTMVPPRFFAWGAIAWGLTVAAKVVFAVAFNQPVAQALYGFLPSSLAGPLLWLYIGLLTGIFECGGVLLIASKTKLKEMHWIEAVAFGIGFGAIEAMLLGLISYASLLFVPEPSLSPLIIPASAIERTATMFIHVFSNVLIVLSVRSGSSVKFWESFFYKTSVDGVAAFANLSYGIESLSHIYTLELIVTFFGIIGFLGLRQLKRKFEG